MTTNVKVICNGDYVASVKVNGVDAGTVGPGSMVEKTFQFNHGDPSTTYEVSERPATPEEIEAAKAPPPGEPA